MGEEGSSRYDCCFFIAQGCDAQGCVRKLAALLHAPRAASREDESSLLDSPKP